MKKSIRIILLILLLNMGVGAQNVESSFELKWDKVQSPSPKYNISDCAILKCDSNNVYYYLNTFKGQFKNTYFNYLVEYDRKKNTHNLLEITKNSGDDKLTYLKYDTINNEFHYFSYLHNRKDKKLYLYVDTYDYVKLIKKNEIKKVVEVDLSDKGSEVLNVFLIHDNGRFMFRYTCNSNKGRFYGLEVLNRNMDKEWSTYVMAQTEEGYNIESNYRIDNEGNVYAIQRNFEKGSDINLHYDRSRVWVVCYPKDGTKPISQPLLLKDKNFIPTVQLSTNYKNEVICAGLYSMPGTESVVGAFSFIIEPLLTNIDHINYKEFSKELIVKGYDTKKAEKDINSIINKKDFEKNFGYNLNKIHYRNDNGFDIIAEKYYKVIETQIDNGVSYEAYHYHYYDDLWVLNFNPDGTFKWIQKIPKYEYVINNYNLIGSYFLYYDQNNSFNFIFNIAKSKKNVIQMPVTNSTTVCVKLDENGNEKFFELINDNEISKTFAPRYCSKISDNEILTTCLNFANAPYNGMGVIRKKDNSIAFGTLKLK